MKTDFYTDKQITDLIRIAKQVIKKSCGYDSVTFIKKTNFHLIFNVKAKNGCGYKGCDIDEYRKFRWKLIDDGREE